MDSSTDALLQLDAGLEIFNQSDEKEVRKEQENIKGAIQTASELKDMYINKAKQLHPAPKAKGKAKAKALAGDRRSAWCRAGAPASLPAGFVEHAEAKAMLPPGATIWRMLQVGGWMCHLPPYPRAPFPFNKWGPRASLICCLQHCWHLFLLDRGLPDSECPIRGMFAESFAPLS